MTQKKLARALKGAAILVLLLVIAFFYLLIPEFGRELAWNTPDYAHLFWWYLGPIWACSIPILLALGYFWGICTRIGRDQSFCHENAKALDRIGLLALLDTALSLAATILLALLTPMHISFLILEVFIVMVGIVITVVCAALSRLVEKAAQIKDENDLTI